MSKLKFDKIYIITLDHTQKNYDLIADKFTNKKLFQVDDNNLLKRDYKKKLILKDYALDFNL